MGVDGAFVAAVRDAHVGVRRIAENVRQDANVGLG